MNELNVAIETVQSDVNLFGIQLEEPMPNHVGKSTYHKIYGSLIDALKQDYS